MAKAPRKRRTQKVEAIEGMPSLTDDGLIQIPTDPEEEDSDEGLTINPTTGAVTIENDDGSVTIDPTGASLWQKPDEPDTPEENLAFKIDPTELRRIAEKCLTDIDSDKQGRTQWLAYRAKIMDLLGVKLEDPKGDVSRSALGMSTSVVRDPTLLMAVNFFRANAYAELCPSMGPVKVVCFDEEPSLEDQELAEALQTDLNFYLTTTASEYYPDMYFMLWWTGLASGTFKKIYMCPLRKRPVSEYVDGSGLIVPSNATDLKNASRVTHEATLSRSDMRAMQLDGVYRDIVLMDPMQDSPNAVQQKAATITGINAQPQQVEDENYTIYECYCKLDIKGYEHTLKGKPTGLPLPYRVTIDETSREVLEIRRNWDPKDDDELYRPAQIPFVLFPFSTDVSRIYGSGLGHQMGNVASALTALLRISIDNGILGNYPGLIKAKGPARDTVNEMMIPPGGVIEIDTGGLPIQQFLMSAPFKDSSPNVMQLMEQTRGVAQRLGGTADMPLGEGKQDAPVGTTLALIDQATKPLSATHKNLHAAQAEEFRLLVKLIEKNPETLFQGNDRPALGSDKAARLEKLKMALSKCRITPMADPNVPSEMHRKLVAMGLLQMAAPGGVPDPSFNQVEVKRYVAKTVYKVPNADFNKFLAPPQAQQPPPINPLALEDLRIKGQNAETQRMKVMLTHQTNQDKLKNDQDIAAAKMAQGHAQSMASSEPDPLQARALDLKQQQINQSGHKMMVDAHQKHAELNSKEAIEALKLVNAAFVHPDSQGVANQEMAKVSDIIAPAAQNNAGAPPMSGGGPVKSEEEELMAAAHKAKLAELVADFILHTRAQNGYMN